MNEAEQRAAVVVEARSWVRTPYVSHARIKGLGADCGTFLAAVYANAGVFIAESLPCLPPQWFLHNDREWYLEYLAKYAVEYELGRSQESEVQESGGNWIPFAGSCLLTPSPGDILCARHGRAYSHGAIVTAWPVVVHCFPPCVQESNVYFNPVYCGQQ